LNDGVNPPLEKSWVTAGWNFQPSFLIKNCENFQ
jgi:hypothetical protein